MDRDLLKRSVCNIRMVIVVLLIVALFFNEYFITGNILYSGWKRFTTYDIAAMVTDVLSTSYFTIIAGMIPGIPYGFSLLEERNSGFLRFQLSRMSVNQYIGKKICYVGLSGGLSMVLPYFVLLIPVSLLGAPTTEKVHYQIMEGIVGAKTLYTWNGYFYILLQGIVLFLFGITWAELSLLISLYVRNRYLAFVMPVIIYHVWWLFGSTKGYWQYINPIHMITYGYAERKLVTHPFFVFGVYIMLLFLLIIATFRKQVRNGKI